MPTQRHSIVTVSGRNKEALKTALNEAVVFTEIALGDGDRFPGGGETALENEVFRGAITNSGTETGQPDAVWFDLYIAQEVPTFHAREIGLFDEDGVLYALSRFETPVPKFGPDSANLSDNTFRIVVVFSATENIVVETSPVIGLTPDRKINTTTGLSGGGDLTSDLTFVTDWSNLVPLTAQISGASTLNMRQGSDQTTISMSGLLAWLRGLLDNDGDDLTHDFVTFNDKATNDVYGIVRLSDVGDKVERLTFSELKNYDASRDERLIAQSTIKNLINVSGFPFTAFGDRAAESNSGKFASAFGEFALQNNTNLYVIGFGREALRDNTGIGAVGVGLQALSNNTGGWSVGVGGWSLQNNTGGQACALGTSGLRYNSGDWCVGVGHDVLHNNCGDYAFGAGSLALRYNVSNNVTALGHGSGSLYSPGIPKLLTAVATNVLTIPNHGFGPDNANIVIRVDAADTPAVGLGVGSIVCARIINANTLNIAPFTATTPGVNVMVSNQIADFTNSTMLGHNSQASGPNEVRLGDANVQHVRTDGSFRTSKGVQSGTYQFNALPAPATMGKGARIWTDANMMLVSTGLKWMPIGQQIWAAHDGKTVFGFASVSIAIVGAEQIKSYVFSVPVPNASYIIQCPSMTFPVEVVEQTVNGFKLDIGSDVNAHANNTNILVIWTGREVDHVPPENLNVYVPPPSGGGGYVGSPPDTEGFGGNDP